VALGRYVPPLRRNLWVSLYVLVARIQDAIPRVEGTSSDGRRTVTSSGSTDAPPPSDQELKIGPVSRAAETVSKVRGHIYSGTKCGKIFFKVPPPLLGCAPLLGWAQLGKKGAQTGTASCDFGDPQRADWTFTDAAKGCGDVGSRFLVLCDRSELVNGCANGAGTDFDCAALIKQEAFEKCWAHSPLRAAACPFTRCRYCTPPLSHRCPRQRQQQRQQRMTEGTIEWAQIYSLVGRFAERAKLEMR